jgi:hypothetical protein
LDGAWDRYDASRIDETEASSEFADDREYEQAGKKLTYTHTELLKSGWTDTLIARHLGEAPARYSAAPGARPMRIWRGRDVAVAEADPAFHAAQVDASRRSASSLRGRADRKATAQQAREHAAVEVVQGLRIDIPHGSADELEQAALDYANERVDDPDDMVGDLSDVPQATIDEWVRTYVTHECTDYDRELGALEARFEVAGAASTALAAAATQHLHPRIDDAVAQLS